MAYFKEGSEAMVALEAMVDKVGMANVLYALGHIAAEKAEHLAANWQDKPAARHWQKRANTCNAIAASDGMHD